MSTWHHGTIELFDSEAGGISNPGYEPIAPTFPCELCGKSLPSREDLRQHRFENHPLRRPILYVRGREAGEDLVYITAPLAADEVHTNGCERAFINDQEIPVDRVPQSLAAMSSGVCRLGLLKTEVRADFRLDFRVALPAELDEIDGRFAVIFRESRLDSEAIETLISTTAPLRTATGYVDGICEYLYGLKSKSGTSTTSPRNNYVSRFNRAVNKLTAYDTPLARAITAAIEFHFNHFLEVVELDRDHDIGVAASRYALWTGLARPSHSGRRKGQSAGRFRKRPSVIPGDTQGVAVDGLTLRIVDWVVRPRIEHTECTRAAMEQLLERHADTYDGLKLRVLLAELLGGTHDTAGALRHAKAVRNVPGLEPWAEDRIARFQIKLRPCV